MIDFESTTAPRRRVRRWAQVVIVLGSVIVLVGLVLPWRCHDAPGTICQAGLHLSRSATDLGGTVRYAVAFGVIFTMAFGVLFGLRGERLRVFQLLVVFVGMTLNWVMISAITGPGRLLLATTIFTTLWAHSSDFDRKDPGEQLSWFVRGHAIVSFLISLVLWLSTKGEVAVSVAPGPLVALIGATIMMVATFPDIVVDVPPAAAAPEHPRE